MFKRYLLLFATSTLGGSFVNAQEMTINTPEAVISGSFGDVPDSTKVELWILDPSILGGLGSTKHATFVENGHFKFNLKIEHPVYFALLTTAMEKTNFERDIAGMFHGFMIHPMVEPNDSLYLTINKMENFKYDKLLNLKFDGIGSQKNKCIQDIFHKLNTYKNGPTDDIDLINRLKQACLEILSRNESKLSQHSYEIMKTDLTGIFDKVLYDHYRQNDTNRLEDYVNTLKVDDTSASEITQYSAYGKDFFIKRAIVDSKKEGKIFSGEYAYGLTSTEYYDLIKDKYKGALADLLIGDYLIRTITRRYSLDEDIENVIRNFLSKPAVNQKYQEQVSTTYSRIKNILKKTSLDFNLIDTLGTTVNLKQFQGKVVVIDFMFNGCVGCRNLVPSLSEIEQQFPNKKEVVFISISIDESITRWKKGIGVFSSHRSISLNTNGLGTEHEIIKYYNVSAYPTIVLLDKSGKVIKNTIPSDLTQFKSVMNNLISGSIRQ